MQQGVGYAPERFNLFPYMTVRDNLALCMARKPTPDPTRYLLSDTANQLFDDIQTAYA